MHPYSTRKPVELFGLKGRPACVVFDKFVSQCLINPSKSENGATNPESAALELN